MEVQGTMALEVANEDDAYLRVHIESGANKGFQFKTHPNIDKGMHTRENILCLKDPNRPFPTGCVRCGRARWGACGGRACAGAQSPGRA